MFGISRLSCSPNPEKQKPTCVHLVQLLAHLVMWHVHHVGDACVCGGGGGGAAPYLAVCICTALVGLIFPYYRNKKGIKC